MSKFFILNSQNCIVFLKLWNGYLDFFLTITVDITARMHLFIIGKLLLHIIMLIKIKYSSKMYDHKNNENKY